MSSKLESAVQEKLFLHIFSSLIQRLLRFFAFDTIHVA